MDGNHHCYRCRRNWMHDNCKGSAPAVCPECAGGVEQLESNQRDWKYTDEFKEWVLKIRRSRGKDEEVLPD